MNMTPQPRLPLRIPGGWRVRHNELRTFEPDATPPGNPAWTLFTQDLALFENESHGLLIDVGWGPEESPAGTFRVSVILDEDWQRPLATFKTRKLDELTATLEAWLERPPEIPSERLVERLADPRPGIRSRAARALKRRNVIEAIEPLRDAAAREKDQKVVDQLADAMRALIHERKRRES